jgi:hypothetical protein
MADDNDKTHGKKEEVEVTSKDQKFLRSVEHGVMDDDLDYKTLYFWSGFIIVMVAIFLVALIEMFDYTSYILNEGVQEQATYTQIDDLKESGRNRLNSFGVVDAEQNVYHIPIDSAINRMAQDSVQ